VNINDSRPILRAIILDCSSVNHVDITSIQALVDTRHQLDRHAFPEPVEWHFANVTNRWARRAFAAAGFGYPSHAILEANPQWKPTYTVATLGRAGDHEKQSSVINTKDSASDDGDRISSASGTTRAGNRIGFRLATVQGVNRPFFHLDVSAALETAIADIQTKVGHH
jgi:solute carrier family 26 (sodium-independent sulfate anion transporter), member 11